MIDCYIDLPSIVKVFWRRRIIHSFLFVDSEPQSPSKNIYGTFWGFSDTDVFVVLSGSYVLVCVVWRGCFWDSGLMWERKICRPPLTNQSLIIEPLDFALRVDWYICKTRFTNISYCHAPTVEIDIITKLKKVNSDI